MKKNGLIGTLLSWRVNGKSYDSQWNEIEEVHENDCLCCRKYLLKPKPEIYRIKAKIEF